ncbi:MAG: polysaccharide deacetylase family protein, partial [Candidatus Kapabacteria bacterium]|nr:polysaccharide deacetylase family protein [Candidatus Kapabacteria bacterium]
MQIWFARIVLIGSILISAIAATAWSGGNPPSVDTSRPSVSFTFDDGSTDDAPGLPNAVWNGMLLGHLRAANIKAVFFACGGRLQGERGAHILQTWNDAGHAIANHTYSHRNYSAQSVTTGAFTADILRNDSILRRYSGFMPLFRFPYLKEGNTIAKVTALRDTLTRYGYRNGYVSIDASDWYVNSRMLQRLGKDSLADISGYRAYYIEHLYNRARYYDSLSVALTGRRVRHVLLLHHNPAAALFLADLIAHFKKNGWIIGNAPDAYSDPMYSSTVSAENAGESI